MRFTDIEAESVPIRTRKLERERERERERDSGGQQPLAVGGEGIRDLPDIFSKLVD